MVTLLLEIVVNFHHKSKKKREMISFSKVSLGAH